MQVILDYLHLFHLFGTIHSWNACHSPKSWKNH